MKNRIAIIIATFFYVGRIPLAPGTWGTVAAIPLYYLISISGIPYYFYILLTLIFILVSVWAAGVTEKVYRMTDPGFIVADEVCGYLVTMILVPPTVKNIILGFVLFRIFDIIKPPPSRQMERLQGGWGVVMDDVLAGVYACIILHVLTRFWF